MVMTGRPQAGQAVFPPGDSTAQDPCVVPPVGPGSDSCEQGPIVMVVSSFSLTWEGF